MYLTNINLHNSHHRYVSMFEEQCRLRLFVITNISYITSRPKATNAYTSNARSKPQKAICQIVLLYSWNMIDNYFSRLVFGRHNQTNSQSPKRPLNMERLFKPKKKIQTLSQFTNISQYVAKRKLVCIFPKKNFLIVCFFFFLFNVL